MKQIKMRNMHQCLCALTVLYLVQCDVYTTSMSVTDGLCRSTAPSCGQSLTLQCDSPADHHFNISPEPVSVSEHLSRWSYGGCLYEAPPSPSGSIPLTWARCTFLDPVPIVLKEFEQVLMFTSVGWGGLSTDGSSNEGNPWPRQVSWLFTCKHLYSPPPTTCCSDNIVEELQLQTSRDEELSVSTTVWGKSQRATTKWNTLTTPIEFKCFYRSKQTALSMLGSKVILE